MYRDPQDPRRLATRRAHYYKNKDIYTARMKERRRQIRALLDSVKSGVPCMDCGRSFPKICMDFDHRPGEIKEITPSQMVRTGWSDARILAELAKCDIVCSNCHRIRTAARLVEDDEWQQ